MNCDRCEHKIINKDGGHCYMFGSKTLGDFCGQEKPVTIPRTVLEFEGEEIEFHAPGQESADAS